MRLGSPAPVRLFIAASIAATGAPASSGAATARQVAIPQRTAASSPQQRFDALVARVKTAMMADPAHAVDAGNNALSYARSMRSPRNEATAQWLLGEAFMRVNQPQKAVPLLEQARQEVDRIAPFSRLQADVVLSLGCALTETGHVSAALTNLHHAYDLFRRLGEQRSQAKALISMALLYDGGMDSNGALRYLDEADEIYKADPGLSLTIYNARGSAFKDLNRFDAAEGQYSQALKLARGMSSDLLVAQVLSNIARVRLMRNDLSRADRAIAEGIALIRRQGAAPYRPLFQVLAAQSALQHHDLPRAKQLIDARFAGVDVDKTGLGDRDAHEVAYRVYAALREDRLALEHLAALKRLDDRATELARSNSAALAGARFDSANQELRIAKLKADDLQRAVAYQRQQVRNERVIFGIAGGGTALIIALLLLGVVTLRRSRNRLAMANVALGKALAAKTEFLATTSHEIRTPLNGILGMTQVMLADRGIDHATRERLGVVHDAGVNMRALVDDILDVAKMETGRMTIEQVPFDARRTIVEASRMWGDQARAKGLSFAVALDDGPGWIVGDSARLRQIVYNLLSNAVKFTALGGITVSAAVADGRWQVRVADTGIGIAADKHQEIFEAFRQADAGTTRQFGGTGLGLAICRNLARAMGGDVRVESAPGEGAAFTLDLPLAEAAMSPAGPGAERATGGPVLVVDRNPITRAMLKALLEAHGGRVILAGAIGEAIAAIADRAPPFILLDDATIRRNSGFVTAITQVRAAAGAARIVLLAAADAAHDIAALRSAGADQVLIRPVGKEALVAILFDEPSASPVVSASA